MPAPQNRIKPNLFQGLLQSKEMLKQVQQDGKKIYFFVARKDIKNQNYTNLTTPIKKVLTSFS